MSDWIEHDGFSQPVPNDTIVDVKFANGEKCYGEQSEVWDWGEEGDYAIVAYRVIE